MPPIGRVVATVALIALIAGCSSGSPATWAPPVPAQSAAPSCGAWGCDQEARFTAASALIARQKGHLAVIVTDRETGQVWRGGDPQLRSWAGSTPKLALTVSLLEEERAKPRTLNQADRDRIAAMLAVSDNDAAEELWDEHADSAEMMRRWQTTYGMTKASYVDGWDRRWGFVKLTVDDLTALMRYVLEKLNATDRAYVVDRMRTVGGPQHWGVWGAGPSLRPGVKDGWDWCVERGQTVYRWVTSTVGFVGPNERYVVAALYDEDPAQDLAAGVHVLSDLAATLFGAPVPATVEVPEDV